MLNVYLLRHGETPWNADGNRYCGRTDVPLTEKGLGQARAVEEQLRNVAIDAIYSSPLQRAWHTAKIAGGGREVVLEPRLIEADFGNWEKKRKEEFIPENEALWADWCKDPGSTRAGGTGETAMEVVLRVNDFFEEAVRRHATGNILVAAHNGVNRFYLAWKLGMPLRHYRRLVQENSSVTLFSLDAEGELTLKLLNARL
ncbi:MAG: histidine phosphatase family protein [Bacteroidota bacterium]